MMNNFFHNIYNSSNSANQILYINHNINIKIINGVANNIASIIFKNMTSGNDKLIGVAIWEKFIIEYI